jgi:hypothetical protein
MDSAYRHSLENSCFQSNRQPHIPSTVKPAARTNNPECRTDLLATVFLTPMGLASSDSAEQIRKNYRNGLFYTSIIYIDYQNHKNNSFEL